MSGSAMVFMALSWVFVLGLTAWSFGKVLRHQGHHDPDGIGPASPAEQPDARNRDRASPPPAHP